MTKYDRIYYWRGGSIGQWHEVEYSEKGREELRRMGFVAHNGLSTIGPPEGAPSAFEINEVLKFRPVQS